MRPVPLAATLLCASASLANATTYTYTLVQLPHAVITAARAFGPNNTVLGYDYTTTAEHAFLASATTTRVPDVPGASQTYPYAYAGGAIVGTVVGTLDTELGYVQKSGTVTTLAVPQSQSSSAYDINSEGEIVGAYAPLTGAAEQAGFVRLPSGSYQTISITGSYDTAINGVNAAGDLVGDYRLTGANVFNGMLIHQGAITTINVPGAYQTILTGINSSGQIVGYFQATNGAGYQGFVDTNGTFTTLAPPLGTNVYAWHINDSGQIIGFYIRSDSQEIGYIATPSP